MTQPVIQNGNKQTSSAAPEAVVENILLVPLTQIYIDPHFNARSGNWKDDPESTDAPDGGFQGLLESLKISKTNRTPVELRPTRDPEVKKKFPYSLVAGFRRCECARLLEWTHVRAIVKDMTDYEARVRNIQEGTAHSNLKTADLAWAIGDMKEKGGEKLKDADIAKILGISQSYVSVLRRIQTDVKPSVTKAWRESNLKVSVPDMQRLTALKPEQHEEEWKKLAAGRTESGRKEGESPYMKLKKRVTEEGRKLGLLEQLDAIKVNKKAAWDVCIQELFNLHASINAANLVKLAAAFGDGYTEGLTAPLKSAADEEDDEKVSK